MSSRFGPRAAGTDGADFKHRQRVAGHYKDSVTFKFWLRCLFVLHLSVLLALWVKLAGQFLVDSLGVNWKSYKQLDLPPAYPWEYVWSFGIVSIILGVLAMPRNNVHLMKLCYYSMFITGIMPCAMGLGGQFPEFIEFVLDPNTDRAATFRGTFPMIIIWYIFFVIALQIHCFAMYCCYQLIAAWHTTKAKDN